MELKLKRWSVQWKRTKQVSDVKADGDGIFACVDVACWIPHTYVFASSTCQLPGGDHAFQVETTPDRRIVVSPPTICHV
jgi:hypothetical protein